MKSKTIVVNGTYNEMEGVIICDRKKITFFHKSGTREASKRWYFQFQEHLNINIGNSEVSIHFLKYGRVIEFRNLSDKGKGKFIKFKNENIPMVDKISRVI